jgi:hypothetical protein
MPRAAIIQPDQSYTFADYFKLNFAPQDILAYFKVSLQRRSLNLPRYSGNLLPYTGQFQPEISGSSVSSIAPLVKSLKTLISIVFRLTWTICCGF